MASVMEPVVERAVVLSTISASAMTHRALLVLCAVGSAALDSEAAQFDLSRSEVQAILQARDSGLCPAVLAFRVYRQRSEGDILLEEGWWMIHSQGYGYGIRMVREDEAEAMYYWGNWDSVRFRELSAVGRDIVPPFRGASIPSLKATDESTDRDAYYSVHEEPNSDVIKKAYYPVDFGLGLSPRLWSELLAGECRLIHLGQELVEKQTCQKLLLDLGEESSPSPWLLWVDLDETFLVLKVESLLAREQVPGGEELPAALTYKGRDWLPFQRWTVREVFEAAPGQWLSKVGIIEHPSHPKLFTFRCEIDIKRVAIRAELDELLRSLLDVQPPSSRCRVDDHVEGKSYYISANGQSLDKREEEELSFGRLVEVGRSLRGEVGEHTSGMIEHHQIGPLGESSCGPNALYLFALIAGKNVQLPQLLSALPSSEKSRGVTSMKSLVAMAADLRIDTQAVSLDLDSWKSQKGWSIIRFAGNEGGHGHYSLAFNPLSSAGVVSLFDPPDSYRTESFEGLRDRWSGQAILLERKTGWWWSQGTKYVVGGALMFAFGLFAQRRARQWHNST